MASRAWILLALISPICACSDSRDDHRAAISAFTEFQDALFRADRGRLRQLLTEESRQAADQLDLSAVQGKQPLRVLGASGTGTQVLVEVEDPNDDDRQTCFVVVRECGAMRVDLVASVAFNHEETPRADSAPVVEPRSLEPWEIDRVRAMNPSSFR